MDAITELMKLVPPPTDPKNHQGNWEAIEKDLGITFPSDYKAFVELYGTGVLCTFFCLVSPFGISAYPNARAFWLNWVDYYQDLEDAGVQNPFPVYPHSPGLLPCGTFGDVDVINWYTEGEADQWSIVYNDIDFGFLEVKNMRLVEFIVAVLSGSSPLPEKVISKAILDQPKIFRVN